MKVVREERSGGFWRTELGSLRRWGAATVLCTVAATHAWRVHAQDLTQWKGGGFGMFSTIDSGGTRKLLLRLRSDGLEYVGRIPRGEQWKDELDLVERLPSRANMENLLGLLARARWMPAREARSSKAYEPSSDADWYRSRSLGIWPSLTRARRAVLTCAEELNDPSMSLVLPESLTLEVQRTTFDLGTGVARLEPVTELTVQGLSPETLAEEWGCSLDYLQALRAN